MILMMDADTVNVSGFSFLVVARYGLRRLSTYYSPLITYYSSFTYPTIH